MILFLIFLVIPFASAESVTIDNTTDIQESVNAVADDEIISLNEGVYKQSGIEINKNITIQGKGSPQEVILDGDYNDSIIKINSNSKVTFKNITFIRGYSIFNDMGDGGGAIQSQSGGHVIIENCIFKDNIAENMGGAVFIVGTLNKNLKNVEYGSLTATNCQFINNTAYIDGGAVNTYFGHTTITDSTFKQNMANRDGGAISIRGSATTTLKNCLIEDNYAVEWAGGIHNWLGEYDISNCSIINNTAGTYGGAFYSTGPFLITDSEIIDNTAGMSGGLIYSHKEEKPVTPTIIFKNNKIIGNTANDGTLVYFRLMDPNDSNFDGNYWGDINPNSSNWNESFVTNGVFESPKIWYTFEVETIKASDITRGYNSPYDFIATFFTNSKKPLADTDVIFKVKNKNYTVKTDSNGVAKLTLKLKVGKYSITAVNPVTGSEVTRQANIVSRITSNKDVTKDYLDSKTFTAKIIGDDGKAVGSGVVVTIKLNGVKSTLKTNKNGIITKQITLTSGKYNIEVSYKGITVKNKITVKQILKSKNVSVKVKKPITVTATLKYSNGKALKNKKITFKFKGKTYSAKTNSKGIAKITIKNKFKAGKYSITIKYVNQAIKQTVTIKK